MPHYALGSHRRRPKTHRANAATEDGLGRAEEEVGDAVRGGVHSELAEFLHYVDLERALVDSDHLAARL
jgi:hypothetical protein